jgi:hypothetical protein
MESQILPCGSNDNSKDVVLRGRKYAFARHKKIDNAVVEQDNDKRCSRIE